MKSLVIIAISLVALNASAGMPVKLCAVTAQKQCAAILDLDKDATLEEILEAKEDYKTCHDFVLDSCMNP